MPRVICDLPNASHEISGVKFHPLEEGGVISDEISQEQAELFASIPGYTIDEEERDQEEVVPPPPPPPPTTRKGGKAKAVAAAPAAPVVEPPAPVAEPEATKGDAGNGDNEEVF